MAESQTLSTVSTGVDKRDPFPFSYKGVNLNFLNLGDGQPVGMSLTPREAERELERERAKDRQVSVSSSA